MEDSTPDRFAFCRPAKRSTRLAAGFPASCERSAISISLRLGPAFNHSYPGRSATNAALCAVAGTAGDWAAPLAIIRLAIKMAASDDEIRVAATPYGIAVTIALHDFVSPGGYAARRHTAGTI